MIEFKSTNAATTLEDLLKVEDALGVVLPSDYKAFLLQRNGGRLNEYEAEIPSWGTTPVVRLLGVGAEGRSGLIFQATRMSALLPAGVIPVGDDPGGNFFCIATDGPNAGEVLLWDHEWSTPDDDSEFKLIPIARNFSSFITCLRRI